MRTPVESGDASYHSIDVVEVLAPGIAGSGGLSVQVKSKQGSFVRVK